MLAGYRLSLQGPLHVGPGADGLEASGLLVRSDTLWSALVDTWVRLHGRCEVLDAFVKGTPPFRLSSAFPCVGSTLFVAKPAVPARLEDSDPRTRKAFAEADLVPLEVFEAWIGGHDVAGYVGAVRAGVATLRAAVSVETTLRNAMDRLTRAAALYTVTAARYAPGAGLCVLVEWTDRVVVPAFERVLRALGEAGLGGERSVGYGGFAVSPCEVAVTEPDDPPAYVTLAVVNPEPALAARLAESAYGLLRRGGWTAAPEGAPGRRRTVRMLAEGSVFPVRPEGCVCDVTPGPGWTGHRVYRSGLAFPLGFARGIA